MTSVRNPGTSSAGFYWDDVVWEAIPSCITPTAATIGNITANSANISWSAPLIAPAGGYEYYYSTSSTAPLTTTTASGTTAAGITTATTGTLNPNTTYYVWTRSICSATNKSAWSPVTSFTTLCVAYTTPYFEGFETGYTQGGSVAGCLSQNSVAGGSTWLANNTLTTYNRTPRTGSWNAFLQYSNEDWIFIPIQLTVGTNYTVSLYARQDGATATNSNVAISYGTTNTTAGMTNSIVAATGILNGNYQLITGNFTPATTGVYYVGIKGYMNGSPWYISLDDISIDVTPTCLTPTALASNTVTTNTANIAWTASTSLPANGYEYYYSTTNTAPTATTTPSGATLAGITTAALSSLTANTTYYFWVRSVCSTTDKSAWTDFSTFYTGYCNPAPSSVDGSGITNVAFSNINNPTGTETNNYGNYSAMVGNVYQGQVVPIDITFATGYTYDTKIWIDWNNDLDFNDAGEEVYVGVSLSANPTTLAAQFTVPAATALGQYRMRIGSQDAGPPEPCYTGSWGSYEDYTINVTPAPSCIVPSGLNATNLSSSGATLNWLASPSVPANGYDYYYSTSNIAPTATTTPSGTTAAGVTTVVLNTLNDITQYYVWVRSNCSPTDKSSWSASATFTTLIAPPACGGTFYDHAGSSSNYGNYRNDTTTIHPVNPGDVVTVTFTTFATEEEYDGLMIYDGPDATAPLISSGSTFNSNTTTCPHGAYTGTGTYSAQGLTFTSTHPSGALTFIFRSDVSSTAAGWVAPVTCAPPTCIAPVVALGNDTAICVGSSLTLNAGTQPTGTTFAWTGGATTQSINVTTAGTYIVTATNGTCIDSDTIIVTTNALPTVDLGVDTLVCDGGPYLLNAGSTTGNTYVWTGGASTTNTLGVTASGTYSVVVTNAAGCSAVDTVVVTIGNISDIALGNDTTICEGATLTLDAGIQPTGATFAWTGGTTLQTLDVTISGTYIVTATNGACSTSDTINVAVQPLPIVDLGNDTLVCDDVPYILNAGGTASDTYVWSGSSSTSDTMHVTASGTYHVIVTSAFGCTSSDTVNVTIGTSPTVDGIISNTPNGSSYSFEGDNVQNAVTYTWDFGDGSPLVSAANATHTYAQTGVSQTLTVTLIVSNDCGSDTVTTTITVPGNVGINKLKLDANALKMYPNPAVNSLVLENNSAYTIKKVIISNVLGQQVLSLPIHNKKETINISNLNAGLYNVSVEFEEGIVTRKLNIIK